MIELNNYNIFKYIYKCKNQNKCHYSPFGNKTSNNIIYSLSVNIQLYLFHLSLFSVR